MTSITELFAQLKNDEAGFIVSSELVLIATVCVLPLVVGLSEVSCCINEQLSEMATSFCATNQADVGWNGSQSQSPGTSQCDIHCGR